MTVALLVALAAMAPSDPPADAPPQAEPAERQLTEPQKLSYALGVNVGRSLLADGLDPDPAFFLDGLRDALTKRPIRLSDEELAALLESAAERVRTKTKQAAEEALKKRATDSRAALARFVKGENVTVRSTGEAVLFETKGEGTKPSADARVRLHYAAWVAGEPTPFFTTRTVDEAGRPQDRSVEVGLENLMPGLRAVLRDVPIGSVVTVGLPPDRAYGPAGGPGVPPNAALLVKIELLAELPPADPRSNEQSVEEQPPVEGDESSAEANAP
ncbi:MAG: FKBP-type peptidyl-prolyl cis-trans isomerase N-terminal domain-containing protein [Planctomycetota bacterium]